jgi:putative ABC transport system substrate-binding protein
LTRHETPYRKGYVKVKRAALAVAVTTALFALALTAEAQRGGELPRIGVLLSTSLGDAPAALGFRDGLRELGYVDGRNVAMEWRGAEGHVSRFPALAAELVQLNVDVIVAAVDPAIQAARAASATIPIVMVNASDPVDLGFVRSLSRPGGNITGLTWQTREAVPKRLQLLKEVLPALSKVAVLWDATEPARRRQVEEAETVAPSVGVQLQALAVQSAADLEPAFAAMTRGGVGAVLVEASSMLALNRARIAELAVKSRLPTIGWFGGMADDGILMSYSPTHREQYRRAAYFVDRILRGAAPADLPVEQPTTFELVINLKTAKALGHTIPPSLLLRADRVIE